MTYKSNWINSILKKGIQPTLVILEKVKYSEWEEKEKQWIKYYRKNNPKNVNTLDGGVEPIPFRKKYEANNFELIDEFKKTNESTINGTTKILKSFGQKKEISYGARGLATFMALFPRNYKFYKIQLLSLNICGQTKLNRLLKELKINNIIKIKLVRNKTGQVIEKFWQLNNELIYPD